MRGFRALSLTASLAALALAACAPATGDYEGSQTDYGPPGIANALPGVIDVGQRAPVSLALQGGLGPILEGQTVNSAVVSLQSIQLVSAEGSVVPLLDQPVTVDLLSAQNSLDQLVSGIPLPPGQFTHMRIQLGGAFIEVASEAGGEAQYFATPGMDLSAYGIPGPAGALALEGMQPGGFFDVAIPPEGIAIQGATSLAMQFDLAQSLFFQSGSWVLSPRAWVVNQSILSSLDVAFEAQAAGFSEFAVQGFEVMLFDSGMRPVAMAPLALLPGGMPGASFQYLAPFQGPFVAVLLPPPGIELSSVVSVSVALQTSVHVETSIVINSFREIRRAGGVAFFDIGAANQAVVIQRGAAGRILRRWTRPVGPLDATMPRVRPHVPLLPGQSPVPLIRQAPYLRGLPRPVHVRPGVRPGGPPLIRPGRPGVRPPVTRPGVPGARPPVTRPGRPGGRPPVTRPGVPGARPPVTRPGVPGTRPPVTRPGVPGARPPVTRPGVPGARPPVTRPGTPGTRPPVTRPAEGPVGRPARPPAERRLAAPPAAPERRPRISPQGPERGHRPPARRPSIRTERPERLTPDEADLQED